MVENRTLRTTPADDVLRRRVKAAIRKRMRGLRNALPASACAERSSRIAQRCLTLEAMARARAVALFWPMAQRHEVDLGEVDRRLRELGGRVAYPAVDRESGAMTFRFVADLREMTEPSPLSAGLREPSALAPEASPGELDVIVVPALAVDPTGHRIGYGSGYYDRVLPRFAPPATTIAVAFDFQLLVEIPWTEHDARVDWVVTDVRALAR